MKGQAKPITNAERRGRIEKARRLMAEQKIDALLLTGGTSLVYFSNIRWGHSERLFLHDPPVKGEPSTSARPSRRTARANRSPLGPLGGNADVRTWQEDESPYARVAQG